ncbi:uncharacterized protein PV09_07980 [Verruconis gallopava]|uniref:RRM domain-containing protein n=1 Tax=Verruconis gallopava TaxID=253628 RepID=A0A0D2A2A4_9PEZI|nr:uncharacterized protein PV09_07980 [Verruconis gallopava]KIW00455.1 hypothetical protein PV09_07980 [Verruconis gallopava]
MEYSQLPSCTVHLRRVDPERLNNDDQIARQIKRLRTLCELMGLEPLDINVKRSLKRKGQAFITFGSAADAVKAQSLLQGFQMVKNGRRMEAEIARSASDVLVKKYCTEAELEEHIKRRKADKDRKRALEAPSATQKRPGDISGPSRPSKTAKLSKASVIPDEYLPPNNTLFVREVPEDYTKEMLEALFGRYPGFKEVRTIPLPQYKGCAFVEYEANEGAIQAREALNGRTIGENTLKVTYQKAG